MRVRLPLIAITLLLGPAGALAQTVPPGTVPVPPAALEPPPPPIVAEARGPAEPMSLAETLRLALAAHPEVAAAERRYDAARQRPIQERSLPDPMVSAGWDAMGNPLPGAGLGSEPGANMGVMVSQEFPYPGKLRLRAEVAEREADAERQQVDAARLNITARVKQSYYRLAADYAIDAVLARNQDLLNALLKVSESRYAVGEAAQQDVIRTQTELSMLALERERIARDRLTREGELNALLKRPVESPLGRPSDLVPFRLEPTLPALVQLADARSPMLRRDQLMVARDEVAIRAAQRDFKPDFGLSGGYYYAGSMPAMYEFRFDVIVPLRRAKRRAAVAERQSALAASRETFEANRLAIQSRLQEDYQMAVSADRLARLYHETVLPQARMALESSVSSYQTGAVDFLSVLTNFGSVLQYEMAYVEELTDLHLAVTRLEEMAGLTLTQ